MSSEWRKSSYSNQSGGSCVEAGTDAGAVLVRDTTDRGGTTLSVSGATWAAFLSTLHNSSSCVLA
jgi:hypothetical protein